MPGQWENQSVSQAPFGVYWHLAGIQFQFLPVTEYKIAAQNWQVQVTPAADTN